MNRIKETNLLDTNGVCHWLAVLSEVKRLEELFGKVTMATLCEHRHLGVYLHSPFERILYRGGNITYVTSSFKHILVRDLELQ